MYNEKILSPRLLKLEEDINARKANVMDEFWKEIEEIGAPIIEDIEGDDENSLVTIVWKQDREIDNIFVFSEAFGGWMFGEGDKKTNLYRLDNSDLWYRSTILSKEARCLYILVTNVDEEYEWKADNVILDPLNSKTYEAPIDDENPEECSLLAPIENIIEMPKAEEKIWVKERLDNKVGRIEKIKFIPKADIKERSIWIYTPYGYESSKDDNNLIVFTDGWDYVNSVEAPKVLDNLIGDKHIPPTCAVFIENSERRCEELIGGNEFLQFVVEEVMNWTIENYRITRSPERTIIAGLSLGGQFAAYTALKHSNVFGKVLSQSGAFAWYLDDKGEMKINEDGSSILSKQYKDTEKLPIDFYFNIGSLETFTKGHLKANDNMISTLINKGYYVTSETFVGAHIYYDWQDNLANGIKALFTNKK
ncbi:MAG: alpha/beta hydrolase-fold protein [Clostridium sp.]|uniref:alpha/beta hydrolase n=1 Tax=Clostridium sp. TaxID=1506 RepID=UPI00306048CF